MNENANKKVCLTIAGLDPSGGAGIIADIKTFSAFGCFAAAAISSITFQNTAGVFGAVHQTADTIRGQIEPILRDYHIDALKTGMLPTRKVIVEASRIVKDKGLSNLVVDPVVRSTSGYDLINDAALDALIEMLFPIALLVTPNIPEAERIARIKISSEVDIHKAAVIMRDMGARNVLIKGGHLPISDFGSGISYQGRSDSGIREKRPEQNRRKAIDYLFIESDLTIFEAEFIDTTATHGTGCTLSAAIAANLAHGKTIIEAVGISKEFVYEAIRTAPHLGKGNSPINIKPI